MKLGVLINAHMVQERHSEFLGQIEKHFADAGVPVIAVAARSTELTETARGLLKESCDGLAAGGGDGTLSTVADLCAREGVPLGVLPLGTHNHFARDAGLPLELEQSIRCVARGVTRRVDLGMVNGCYFINNSSIGAYPRAVEERQRLREQFSLRKKAAGAVAILRVFAKQSEIDARVEIDGVEIERRGPFVFVGNNEYTVNFFAPQLRRSLDSGQLCVYTARCNGVTGLLRLCWRAMWGRLEHADGFEKKFGRTIIIRVPREEVRVSKDGEVLRMRTPLEYQIAPLALEIFSS